MSNQTQIKKNSSTISHPKTAVDVAGVEGREKLLERVGPASDFGFKGPATKLFAMEGPNKGEPIIGDTPDEVVDTFIKFRKETKDIKEEQKTFDVVAGKIKSDTFTDVDLKKITRFNKGTVTASEGKGILRDLGLRAKDADLVMKGTSDIDFSRGGANIFNLRDIIANAKRKGFLQPVPPMSIYKS